MEGKADRNPVVVVARVAWLATFVVPLVLAGLLLAAKGAPAAPTGPAVVPLTFEEEFEDEGEVEEAACEAAEEEFAGEVEGAEVEEICEEAEDRGRKRAAQPSSIAPEECVLRSAHAHAATIADGSKLKLTIGYTTYEPVSATVEIRKGSARIGSVHRHLGRSGVLRIVKSLGIRAPKRIVVQIQIPASPRNCDRFQTETILTRPPRAR
jgi:hypothetical protein